MDTLLECLVILTKMNGHPFSHDALCAGLPLENHQLVPTLFIRAAERAGYEAKIFQRSLSQLSALTLPAVLLLQDNQACLLTQIHEDETFDLIFPEISEEVTRMPRADLERLYSGHAIYVHPLFRFEPRTETKVTQKNPSDWFWSTLWRYRRVYAQVIVAALLINIFALVSPLFVMNVYDRVVPNFAVTTLWVLAIGVFTIFTFDFILRSLRAYLIDTCGKKADILMGCALFQQVLGIQMASKPSSVGAFVSNLREFEVLRDFFTSAVLTTLIDLPFVFFFFLLTWYIGGIVVLVPLIILPLVILSAFLLEKSLRKAVLLALQGSVQKHAILVESITGLETVKCLSAEGQMQKRWEESVGVTAKYGLKSRFISGLVINITNFAQQLVTVGVVVMGVYAIHAQTLTLGGLIACSILAGRILAPLAGLANVLTRFQQAKMALEGLNEIMDMPCERPLGKQFLHVPTLKGDIEFENVSFQYPGQQTLAVDDVSFKISAGERVGVVGRIGSGKSTLQKLLLGLYAPKSGRIRVDGIDISQIDPTDLRRQIGYVPQDSLLFFGTVRDNIAMTKPSAGDQEIMETAQLAGVDKFIHRHPSGYAMPVGERGEGLSGGQRQAIAIARALLASPNVWLFDEPTSSMDNTSEAELIQRLTIHLQQKTVLLTTHRSSLFPLIDRLFVMDNGRLVMHGPKDKVIAALTQQPIQTK